MIVAVFLFVDIGGHLIKTDLLDDSIVKAHRCCLFTVFDGRYDSRDRNNADRQDLVRKDRVDQRALAAFELPDDRYRDLLVFQFVTKLLSSGKLAFGDLIFCEDIASCFHDLRDRTLFLLLRCLRFQAAHPAAVFRVRAADTIFALVCHYLFSLLLLIKRTDRTGRILRAFFFIAV